MIEIRYFARLREQLDTDAEQLDAAGQITVEEILAQLRARGGTWSETFAADQLVMMAVNQEMADPQTAVADGDEVAFFPPVTGG